MAHDNPNRVPREAPTPVLDALDWIIMCMNRTEIKQWWLIQEVMELMATSKEARDAVEAVYAKSDELIVLAKEIKAKLDAGVNEDPEHTADIDAMFDGANTQSAELDIALSELKDFEPSVQ